MKTTNYSFSGQFESEYLTLWGNLKHLRETIDYFKGVLHQKHSDRLLEAVKMLHRFSNDYEYLHTKLWNQEIENMYNEIKLSQLEADNYILKQENKKLRKVIANM